MKKILISLITLLFSLSVNAQIMKIYKGEELIKVYTAAEADRVVFEPASHVVSISLNQTSAVSNVGSVLYLMASVYPNDITDISLVWSSSNPNVATVDNGMVKCLEAGETIITCEASNYGAPKATCKITVKDDKAFIRVAIYETVPGYSVRNMSFFYNDNSSPEDNVYLYKTDKILYCGPLHGFASAESYEGEGQYIGRTVINPVITDYVRTDPKTDIGTFLLKTNYQLIACDGSGEQIQIREANAAIPTNTIFLKYGHKYTLFYKIHDKTQSITTSVDLSVWFQITLDAIFDDTDGDYIYTSGSMIDPSEEEVIIKPSGSGTVADPYNVAGLLKAAENLKSGENTPTELVVKGIVSQVKNDLNPDYGNISYYISDDGRTTEQFYVYRGLGLNGEKFTSNEQVQIGDEVVVQGIVKNYNGTLEFDQSKSKLLSTTNKNFPADIIGDVTFYEETFDSSFGEFTTNDVLLPSSATRVWAYSDKYKCASASGYVGGTMCDSEGWLISPLINLKKATEAYFTFDHFCSKFSVDAATQCTVMVKADNEQVWTSLEIPEWPTGKFVNIANINLSKYVGRKIQVAYKYTSTTTSAGVWEVKNFKLTGFGEAGYNGTTWEEFTNGGFEEWNANVTIPIGWQDDTQKGNAILSRSEDCQSQPYAVSIAGVALGERRMASQALYFEPGTYAGTFSAKAATQAGAHVQAGYCPESATGTIYDTDATGGTRRIELTNENWQEISYSFTIEEGTLASLVIAIPTGSKDKAVLVDDVRLTKLK